jgi:group I intron endonuclease
MKGIIYCATCQINGKHYIGQTSQVLSERQGDHKRKATRHGSDSHFHNAIKKHGYDSFTWSIIDYAKSRDELNEKEQRWIFITGSDIRYHGYNLTLGGGQFNFTDEVKKKIGESQKGRKLKKEQLIAMSKRFSGAGNPFHGKKHTEEAKEKNRAAHLGKKLTDYQRMVCPKRGEDNGRSGITEEIVREIRRACSSGERNCEIQKRLGISKNTLQGVKQFRTWRHVK